MSVASASTHTSSPFHGAAIWISLTLFFLVGLADSPFAQGGPGGNRPGGGGMRPRGGGGEHRLPSPEAIEGPPSPAVMRDSVGVEGEQLQHYSRLYANHTAATRHLRDSLRTTMQGVRSAFESGDRAEARTHYQAGEQRWKELSQRDKAFDKALKDVLTKDQQKRYQKWKESQEKAARERRHRERRPAAGQGSVDPDGGPPGRGNL